MKRKRILWTVSLIAFTTVAALVSAWLQTAPADATSAAYAASESHVVQSVNEYRSQAGLPSLQVDATLTAAAADWTSQMVAQSFLGHADLSVIQAEAPGGQEKVGENVGRGNSTAALMEAFMRSPAHRNNILDPAYTHIGVGVDTEAWSGRVYTTVRFASVPTASQSTPTAPIAPPVAATPEPAPIAPPAQQSAPKASPAPTAAPHTDSTPPGAVRGSRALGLSDEARDQTADETRPSTGIRGSRRGAG